jgi:NADH dehydrogenase [ubiquinone] 1 alpha subcomplex assembly factor 5
MLNEELPPLPSTLAVKTHILKSEAEETALPFPPSTFDAVLSSLTLHWINDLPSHLASIRSILKPDAPFLAAFFGGDTLFELRTSLQLAELEREGGMGVHVSPFADISDIGGLLNKAGFTLITVDVDDIVVSFPSVTALMQDLQAMGESNAAFARRPDLGALKRDVLLAAEGIYKELHGEEDGLPATFRIIYVIGWKEGPNQRKPLPRGSAEVNLKDMFEGQGEKK